MSPLLLLPHRLLRPLVNYELRHLRRLQSFESTISQYRERAKRTLVVQVRAKETAGDLVKYCSDHFGDVANAFFHANPNSKAFANFFLIEFGSRSSLQSALACSRHRRDALAQGIVPVHSPLVWFAADNLTRQSLVQKEEENNFNVFCSEDTSSASMESLLKSTLSEGLMTLDGQLLRLHERLSMDDSSRLLRFLACEQIELAIRGLFPRAQILPFGSSVNSFGLKGCDLDMTIVLDKELLETSESSSRLHFHAKQSYGGDARLQTKAYCQQISEIIRWFLPGCEQVSCILGARVPIIKYRQHLLNLDCDLSLSSKSGYYMSELLFLYGSMHSCVRPLVMAVRQWAKFRGLVEHFRPTTTFTNFSLTLLLLFFLQEKRRILPPLKLLAQNANEQDVRVCEDGVNCTWLRDPEQITSLLQYYQCEELSDAGLETLLREFFVYYAEFDFGRHAVCVYNGEKRHKRSAQPFERLAMYHVDIVNPLEREKNVSANVSQVTMHHFKAECRASIHVLDTTKDDKDKLANLWRRMQSQHISVDVRDLKLEDVLVDPTEVLTNKDKGSESLESLGQISEDKSDNRRHQSGINNKRSHQQQHSARKKKRFSLPRL